MPRILRISLPIALALLVAWAEPSSACHGKKGRGGGGCGQAGYAGMSPATYYGSGMTVSSAAPGNPYAYGYAPGMAGYADGYGYGGGYGPGYGGGYGYGPGYGMNRGGFGGPFSGLGVRPGFGFGGLGMGRR